MVSMPSWELFDRQSQAYRDEVLPPAVTSRISIEAGLTFGWRNYVGDRGRQDRSRSLRRVGAVSGSL
ncbi:MAG: hypothetical protein IPL01_21160 [Acidobacteria bacterium]|nr:hypothetical protein [Acidobacteriota bacterium]